MPTLLASDDLRGLAAGAKLFSVSGGGVVYEPSSGAVMVLNTPAAFAWLCLSQQLSDAQCRSHMATAFALDAETAGRWFEVALAEFSSEQFVKRSRPLHEIDTPDVPQGGIRHSYRLLGRRVDISAPNSAWPRLASFFAALPLAEVGDPAGLAVAIRCAVGDRFELIGNGERRRATLRTLVPELEQLLLRALIPLSSHRMTFHASLMARGDTGLLLLGPSGSGKTTLSIMLAAADWSFGGDELVLLDRDLRWRPVPLPACIKSANFDLVSQRFPLLESLPEHERLDRVVKYLPVGSDDRRRSVEVVYFPQFRPQRRCEIEAVEPLDGLSILLSQCVQVADDFAESDVAALLAWHETARYRILHFGHAWEAAERIAEETARDRLLIYTP